MARKKEPEKAANHERWLVSYADFITLLFAVFVTLYAMSQTDKQKVEQVAASYRSAFGITVGASSGKPQFMPKSDIMPIPAMKQQLKNTEKQKSKGDGSAKVQATKKDFKEMLVSLERYLNMHNEQDKVNVAISKRGLVISLKEAGFFDSGSATVNQASFELLAKIGESLAPYSNPISFEGHTDTLPIRSSQFQSNWELSTARATNLAHHFMDRHGFTPEKVSVTGYGEYRPVADNATEEGRKQNRRVDIVLLGPSDGEIEEAPPANEVRTPPLPF
jgi:chemotaxis protein MotB